MARIGYARVSTRGQSLEQQGEALRAAGCEMVFAEKASAASGDRLELNRLLKFLRAGDLLIVTRLDRLARSTRELLLIVEAIKKAGAGFQSLGEPWADTTTPAGHMILTIFGAVAEWERSLIAERTAIGRKAAMLDGVRFGRPPAVTRDQLDMAFELMKAGRSVSEVARALGVARSTLYKHMQEFEADRVAAEQEMRRKGIKTW